MVVGGGPAGMWAAKIATLRGHDVTLYEKGDELGGQVLLAAKGAGRDEFGVIARNERKQLAELEVPVELGVEVTAEFVLERQPGRGHRGHRVASQGVPGGRRRRSGRLQRLAGAERRGRAGREGAAHRLRRPPPGDGHGRVPRRARQDRARGHLEPLRRLGARTVAGPLPQPAAAAAEGGHLHPRLRRHGDQRHGGQRLQRVLQRVGHASPATTASSRPWATTPTTACTSPSRARCAELVPRGRLRGAAPGRHGHPRGLHGRASACERRTSRRAIAPARSRRLELLVVVEPATDAAAPGADALAAEAVRLAGALEAGLACVTWPAEPPAATRRGRRRARRARPGHAAGGGPPARHRRRPAAGPDGGASLRLGRRGRLQRRGRAGAPARRRAASRPAHAVVRQAGLRRLAGAGDRRRGRRRSRSRRSISPAWSRPAASGAGRAPGAARCSRSTPWRADAGPPPGARPPRRPLRRPGPRAGASSPPGPAARATSSSTRCGSSPTSSRGRWARRGR